MDGVRATKCFVGWLLCALTLVGGPAWANGRYPESQLVAVGPGTASTDVALRVTFGFALSGDSGRSFQWLCEDALGYAQATQFDPGYVLDATGELLVGTETGLDRVSPDRCTVTSVAAMRGEFVRDLDADPAAMTLVAATAPADVTSPAHIYRSDDGGQGFTLAGPGMPGAQYETLEVSDASPRRLYLSGTLGSARVPTLFRSDDGGATVDPLPTPPGMQSLWIAGTDPTLVDTVYVRATLPTPALEGSVVLPTALLRSDDGGHTWRELIRTVGPMTGVAVGADGHTLWVGGNTAADGFQRSTDGGQRWQLLHAVPVLCLTEHGGTLWVCADDHIAPFALARSDDGGETLTPVLTFPALQGPASCPNASTSPPFQVALCPMEWAGIQYTIGQRPPEAMAAPPSSCGCRVGAAGSPWRIPCGLAVAALALSGWRRSRRGRWGVRVAVYLNPPRRG